MNRSRTAHTPPPLSAARLREIKATQTFCDCEVCRAFRDLLTELQRYEQTIRYALEHLSDASGHISRDHNAFLDLVVAHTYLSQLSPAEAPNDDRETLLSLIASLTLCDHMGDVTKEVKTALKKVGVVVDEWGDLDELGSVLGRMGIKTLQGISLSKEDNDD